MSSHDDMPESLGFIAITAIAIVAAIAGFAVWWPV